MKRESGDAPGVLGWELPEAVRELEGKGFEVFAIPCDGREEGDSRRVVRQRMKGKAVELCYGSFKTKISSIT